MSNSRLVALFSVFLFSAPMLACGDDGSGPDVALFINSNVVDYYDPDDPMPDDARAPMPVEADPEETPGHGSEASNMEAALGDLGADVTTFTATDFESIEGVLEGQDVLVLPENESSGEEYEYPNAFDDDAKDTIFDFVADGGTLVLVLDDSGRGGVDFLNEVFGWALSQSGGGGSAIAGDPSAGGGGPGEYAIDTGEAEFTPFEGGPEILPVNNGDYPILTASLPLNASAVYTTISHTGVAVIPVINGRVVTLSYDWFDAEPVGVQDGGWNEVLGASLEFEPEEPAIPE